MLNIPATGQYNATNATAAAIYPSQDEVQGIASFSAMIGLRPQDMFPNCLTFFSILLAGILLISLVPAAILYVMQRSGKAKFSKTMAGKTASSRSSVNADVVREAGASNYELSRTQLQSSSGRSEDDSALSSSPYSKEHPLPNLASYGSGGDHFSTATYKYTQAPTTPAIESHEEDYIRPQQHHNTRPAGNRTGIVRWWAGDKADRMRAEEADGASAPDSSLAVASYYSVKAWLAFCQGLVIRLICFFHLPITILSVYQLAHATTTSSVVSVVFAALAFCIISLGVPVFLVFRIRRTLTRYLQDDTNTLLAFGPVYNTYAQDSYTFAVVRFTANLIEGCVVGGAQNRGTVQVAVILTVEIAETLVTVSRQSARTCQLSS